MRILLQACYGRFVVNNRSNFRNHGRGTMSRMVRTGTQVLLSEYRKKGRRQTQRSPGNLHRFSSNGFSCPNHLTFNYLGYNFKASIAIDLPSARLGHTKSSLSQALTRFYVAYSANCTSHSHSILNIAIGAPRHDADDLERCGY